MLPVVAEAVVSTVVMLAASTGAAMKEAVAPAAVADSVSSDRQLRIDSIPPLHDTSTTGTRSNHLKASQSKLALQ